MSIGAQLRASREAKGLTIDALAHTTRVQPRILAAIEREEIAAVPPRPFGRGFVRAYALEVGLDADRTARDYFAQFAPVPETPSFDRAAAPTETPTGPERPTGIGARFEASTKWTGTWIVAVICLGTAAGVALAVAVRSARTPQSRQPSSGQVGTSGSEGGPSVPDGQAAPAKTEAPPASAPSASSAPLSIVLTASQPSWITADADGRRALYLTLMPGSAQTITARRVIEIRVGDAGALVWRINGRDAGAMGRPGQVRDVVITPATAAAIH
jgi:cytoskeletal protein RodZ